ncbi:hypothetical protein J6TS2_35550 [Heyndrickxia sporothermodurans]|nr:hypothetical protein J6TS2_35550 [Heyndrickxia sporothermodurans]
MEFEKQLRDELKMEAEKRLPSKELKTKVLVSFKQYKTEPMKRRSTMKKRLIAGLVAAVILVPTGVFAGSSLVNKIIGTPEDAKEKYGMVEQEYRESNEMLEVAKKLFTKEEFEKFTVLWKEYNQLNKKAIVVDGKRTSRGTYRLSAEEKKRYKEVGNELDPYIEKIYNKFEYKVDEAQKLVNFPIQHPNYVPKGYQLVEEVARAEVTTGKPEPIIYFTYKKKNADEHEAMAFWTFTIKIFGNMEEKLFPYENNYDTFVGHSFDKLTNYTLDGNAFTLGENSSGKIIGLKMVVPAKDGNSAYQAYVVNSALPKKELEKVLLSMVK